MITRGSSKQFLRVTVDAEPRDAELLEGLEDKSDFGSKRDIFLTGLRLLSSLYRACRRGLRPQLVDPQTHAVIDFDWRNLPQIEPVTSPRQLYASKVSEPVIRTLRACAAQLQDPDLNRISAMIMQAAWDPSGEGLVSSLLLSEFIIVTLGLRDPALLAVTRDLLTQLCTAFKSFDDMLSQSLHGYRPGFDTHFVEQRFLWDEYRRELPLKYPEGYATLHGRGTL
jgi:hypothetical protein